MSYIVNVMLKVMDSIYGIAGNWGVTIMGLTILVRLIVLPLTIVQGRSARRMALIQPELDKLQKKYGDDPERLNLELYGPVSPQQGQPCFELPLAFYPTAYFVGDDPGAGRP